MTVVYKQPRTSGAFLLPTPVDEVTMFAGGIYDSRQ